MLDTLRNLNDHEALILLSSTVHSLLPDPGVGSPLAHVLNAPAESREQLLQELRHKLKLSHDDKSPRAQAEIFNTLSSEISKYALKNVDIRQVKARLGARGDLAPGLYEIEIPSHQEKDLASSGVRPNHIEDCVHSPDLVQHLTGQRSSYTISLFLKHISSGHNPFSLFVLAERDGFNLIIRDAIRIYHPDVQIDSAGEPLSVLRAFLQKYGLPMEIASSRPKLLFVDEVFPFIGDAKAILKAIRIERRPSSSFQRNELSDDRTLTIHNDRIRGTTALRVIRELSVVEIGIAYAFNGNQYDDDLRRHGVPVPTS